MPIFMSVISKPSVVIEGYYGVTANDKVMKDDDFVALGTTQTAFCT